MYNKQKALVIYRGFSFDAKCIRNELTRMELFLPYVKFGAYHLVNRPLQYSYIGD